MQEIPPTSRYFQESFYQEELKRNPPALIVMDAGTRSNYYPIQTTVIKNYLENARHEFISIPAGEIMIHLKKARTDAP